MKYGVIKSFCDVTVRFCLHRRISFAMFSLWSTVTANLMLWDLTRNQEIAEM